MKLAILSESPVLLMEANVFNNTEEHNGTSIRAFAAHYADMLDNDNNKKAFIKKISKLLINDPTYHHAMREVPPEAPDWAHDAAGRQELVYFQPDAGLQQKMEHLTHWINALEHDAKQKQDKDKAAFANKELQGFGKVESLDVMEVKANKYFSRGSKRAKGDVSGLEPRLEAGGGFIWYEIVDAAAFGREGKVLQNCIGSHYTASNLRRSDQKIYVLKNPQGETVVAIRVKHGEKMIEEIKGKQNKPPVEKYMPPVQKFIKKGKMTLSDYGKWDLEAAGYFWIDGQVYTKTDAIKEFLTPQHIDNLGYGLEMVRIGADKPGAERILARAYGGDRYNSRGSLPGGASHVIETRRDGHPVQSALITSDGKLVKLVSHSGPVKKLDESIILEAAANQKSVNDSVEFVNEMLKRGLVKDIDSNLQKVMFWSNHLAYDHEHQQVKPRHEQHDNIELKKSAHKNWEVHKGPGAVNNVLNTIAGQESYSDVKMENLKKRFGDMHEIQAVYLADMGKQGSPNWVMVVVDKDGHGHPHQIKISDNYGGLNVSMDSAGSFAGENYAHGHHHSTDKRMVQAVVDLANHHGFDLPTEFNMLHNVDKNNSGQHERVALTPKDVGTEVPTKLYDLSGLTDDQRLKAMYHLFHGEFTEGETFPLFSRSTRKKSDKNIYHLADGAGVRDRKYHNHGPVSNHKSLLKKGYMDADKVYGITVDYAGNKKHRIMALAKGNKVVKMDDITDGHKWQHWDDSKEVIKQLNAFLKEQGLTAGRDAFRGNQELRSSAKKGTFQTATEQTHDTVMRQRERGNYGKEGTDEIHFDDDSKLVRATPEENADLLRMMPYGSRGEVWKFMDKDGENPGNILVSKNKVKGTFGPAWDDMNQWEKDRLEGKDVDKAKANAKRKPMGRMYRHLKQAADQFGWDIHIPKEAISPDSDQYKFLNHLSRQDGSVTRRQAWGNSIGRSAPSLASKKAWDDQLEGHGLVSIDAGQYAGRRGDWTRSHDIEITQKGRDIVNRIQDGEPVHPIDVHEPQPTHKSWKKPTKKKAAAKKEKKEDTSSSSTSTAAATPAPTVDANDRGKGWKARQALAVYGEMVDDDGNHPSRKDFIAAMMEEPFNMSKSGAATYHYNTKKKYNAQQDVTEALLQSLSGLQRLIIG